MLARILAAPSIEDVIAVMWPRGVQSLVRDGDRGLLDAIKLALSHDDNEPLRDLEVLKAANQYC